MNIELNPSEKDDPDFILMLNRIVNFILITTSTTEVYITQIDNWFDHKWLKFSGIGVVKYDPGWFRESALDEFSQDKITIPPFTPNRIISQYYFLQTDVSVYEEKQAPKQIHKWQHSKSNLQRRISDFSSSGLFGWYSSNTLVNKRGSFMAYVVLDDIIKTWYASFRKNEIWEIENTKGIQREQIQEAVKYVA